MSEIYKSLLNDDEVESMNAKDFMEVESKEPVLAITFMLMIFLLILSAINITALVIWTNKVTLFMTIVNFILVVPLIWSYKAQFKSYKKIIKKYKTKTK